MMGGMMGMGDGWRHDGRQMGMGGGMMWAMGMGMGGGMMVDSVRCSTRFARSDCK